MGAFMAWQRSSIAAGAHVAVVRAEQLERMKKDALCPSARQLLQKSLSQLRGQGAGQLAKVCCVSVTPPHQNNHFFAHPIRHATFFNCESRADCWGKGWCSGNRSCQELEGGWTQHLYLPCSYLSGNFWPRMFSPHHSPAASFPPH